MLQDPLQQHRVLCDPLGYQQDALWNLPPFHQRVVTLLLERLDRNVSTFIQSRTKAAEQRYFQYLDEVLKSFVVLLQLFKKADGFIVTAAELSIHLLHFLPILIRKLQETHVYADSHTHTHTGLMHGEEPTCWSKMSPMRWMR